MSHNRKLVARLCVTIRKMLVPKDPDLAVNSTEDSLEFSWKPDKSGPVMFALFPLIFGLLFIGVSFAPNQRPPTPERFSLITGSTLCALAIAIYFYARTFSLCILARKTELHLILKPHAKRRSLKFIAPPLQFYLSGDGVTNRGTISTGLLLNMIGLDGISHRLVSIASRTMANQIWHDLQVFYRLEDLEVLGEVGHNRLKSNQPTRL